MISVSELKQMSAEAKVDISVLERDYVISWVLKCIYENPGLRDSLVFKGGTALRKTYFPAYRFSEDLDFTTTKPLPELSDKHLETSLGDACRNVYDQSGIELSLIDFRQTRDDLGEEAFLGKIQYIGPRQHRAGALPNIKLDITFFEQVMIDPPRLPLIHNYTDASICKALILTYSQEEIIAEKLRTILQRTRSRDIYDLWYLLAYDSSHLRKKMIVEIFKRKCAYKDVAFTGINDFFSPELIESHRLAWEPSIGRQISDLPAFSIVEEDLKTLLTELLSNE